MLSLIHNYTLCHQHMYRSGQRSRPHAIRHFKSYRYHRINYSINYPNLYIPFLSPTLTFTFFSPVILSILADTFIQIIIPCMHKIISNLRIFSHQILTMNKIYNGTSFVEKFTSSKDQCARQSFVSSRKMRLVETLQFITI